MTTSAIINPNNLKIEGFYCADYHEKNKTVVLLYQDIREIIPAGLVVDDHDVLVEPEELIRLQNVMKLNFELVGKPVYSDTGERLGKVSDYAADKATMYIQKIYVSQSIIKSFSGGGLSIDRNQIVEITSKKIVIQDILKPTKALSGATATA